MEMILRGYASKALFMSCILGELLENRKFYLIFTNVWLNVNFIIILPVNFPIPYKIFKTLNHSGAQNGLH